MLSPALKPSGPKVIEALRKATGSRHAKLASCPAMVRLFDTDYSVSEYRFHLGKLLGLFEPLEDAVTAAATPSDPVCSLRRSQELREDLERMGVTTGEIDKIERCPRIPLISTAGLPGYTYVILGSMIGGKIIARRLRAVLGPTVSLHFYGDEKARYETLWTSFCQDLETNGQNYLPIICDTAIALLDLYDGWFSEPPSRTGTG
jgi:heme oxygenase